MLCGSQSAAALMLGMVPRLTRPGRSKDLVIHYHPYKRDEAMHGVGIRQKSGLNLCRRAVEARSAQFRSNKTFDVHLSSQDELVAAFGSDGVEGQRVVDMLDVIFPGYCQGGHAPCVFRKEMDKPSCLSLEAFADLKVTIVLCVVRLPDTRCAASRRRRLL